MNIKETKEYCDECHSNHDIKEIETGTHKLHLCQRCRIELTYLLLQDLK